MTDFSPHTASLPENTPRVRTARAHTGHGTFSTAPILVAAVAFGLYWLTGVLLASRHAAGHFGADANHYALLADMAVHYRVARFHPVTATMGVAWMKVFSFLTPWLAPATILKAYFAAVGALGVWAVMAAFSVLLPRSYVLLGGILYGSSFGVMYFAGIPESKIVTATLSVLYIASYAHLRERWSLSGAIQLSLILALACLNEVVSAFLVIIPIVDALIRRGRDWRHSRWLATHVPVVLFAWFVLEVVVNGWYIPESTVPQGESHYNMLRYYIAKNDYGLASLHGFIANWFFFNFVAPTPHALHWPEADGYFAPTLLAYLTSPLAIATLLAIALVGTANLVPRYRAAIFGPAGELLLPIAAYAVMRGVFFFAFNPSEPLLFSPAVTFAHWYLLLVPVAASRFPAKWGLLAALCVLLIATNVSFMIGPDGWIDLLEERAS
jgi:hypothetical protein